MKYIIAISSIFKSFVKKNMLFIQNMHFFEEYNEILALLESTFNPILHFQ